jgi:hypothetical protein
MVWLLFANSHKSGSYLYSNFAGYVSANGQSAIIGSGAGGGAAGLCLF